MLSSQNIYVLSLSLSLSKYLCVWVYIYTLNIVIQRSSFLKKGFKGNSQWQKPDDAVVFCNADLEQVEDLKLILNGLSYVRV